MCVCKASTDKVQHLSAYFTGLSRVQEDPFRLLVQSLASPVCARDAWIRVGHVPTFSVARLRSPPLEGCVETLVHSGLDSGRTASPPLPPPSFPSLGVSWCKHVYAPTLFVTVQTLGVHQAVVMVQVVYSLPVTGLWSTVSR